ncbi:Protein of unknown function [Gryllus bimaculatus]|nr:Protein of unknown function [Gryllus bimaculatus]
MKTAEKERSESKTINNIHSNSIIYEAQKNLSLGGAFCRSHFCSYLVVVGLSLRRGGIMQVERNKVRRARALNRGQHPTHPALPLRSISLTQSAIAAAALAFTPALPPARPQPDLPPAFHPDPPAYHPPTHPAVTPRYHPRHTRLPTRRSHRRHTPVTRLPTPRPSHRVTPRTPPVPSPPPWSTGYLCHFTHASVASDRFPTTAPIAKTGSTVKPVLLPLPPSAVTPCLISFTPVPRLHTTVTTLPPYLTAPAASSQKWISFFDSLNIYAVNHPSGTDALSTIEKRLAIVYVCVVKGWGGVGRKVTAVRFESTPPRLSAGQGHKGSCTSKLTPPATVNLQPFGPSWFQLGLLWNRLSAAPTFIITFGIGSLLADAATHAVFITSLISVDHVPERNV